MSEKTAQTDRIGVVDLGRGAVMALMALDHTRTFFTNVTYNPTDLTRTFPALFFTRWVSHFCTPLFLFLAGSGAYFMTTRRRRRDAAWFLVTRGLVLVGLEMTVVRWGWYFNLDYRHTSLQILWAIGVSMMGLAPLVLLPPRFVGAVGVAIVALHNLVGVSVGNAVGSASPVSSLWALLYERGRQLTVAPGVVVGVNFPVLPLFGVMAMGYAFGEVFCRPAPDRRRACLAAGAALLLTFLVFRFFNHYGDPLRWARQADSVHSLLSFLSLTKHPLSLLMTLATLGPALIWLGVLREERPIWQPLVIIGRVPMFFYLVHVPLIHALALAYSLAFFGDVDWLLTSPFDRGTAVQVPAGWGFGLPGVYALWFVVLLISYPLCRSFARLKARSPSRWLSYSKAHLVSILRRYVEALAGELRSSPHCATSAFGCKTCLGAKEATPSPDGRSHMARSTVSLEYTISFSARWMLTTFRSGKRPPREPMAVATR